MSKNLRKREIKDVEAPTNDELNILLEILNSGLKGAKSNIITSEDKSPEEKVANRNFWLTVFSLVFFGIIFVLQGFNILNYSDFILHRFMWLVGIVIALQRITTTRLIPRPKHKSK